MSQPAPKPGDRIHYEGEVTVTGVGDNGGLSYAPDGHVGTLRYRVPPDAKVEVIAPAEPEYEVGGLYVDLNGHRWERITPIPYGSTPFVWRRVRDHQLGFEHVPARPLSRLRSDTEWQATLPSREQIADALRRYGSVVVDRLVDADAVLALLNPTGDTTWAPTRR